MATIVIRVDVTVTSSFTKTTLPPAASDASGTARTMASTDKGVTDYAERARQYWRDQFNGIVPNADAAVTVSNITIT